MTRRRSRGGGPSKGKGLLLLGLVVLLVMGTAPPVLSFDSATVERHSSINVTNDGDAIVGLVTTDGLTAGTEGPLVNTTNAVGSSVTVTLTLQNQSKGDLINGTARGDVLEFGLGTGATENASIDLNCDASVNDRIEYRTEVTDPGFRGDLTRSATVENSVCSPRELVFLSATGLASVTKTDTTTQYDPPRVEHIGPSRADIDGDGSNDIPFTDGGNLNITDQNNDTKQLATGAYGGGNEANLWAGSFNGTDNAVYYTNAQDNLERAFGSGTEEKVVTSGGTDIVGGVGNVDSSTPGEELVVASGSQIKYKTTGGEVFTPKVVNVGGTNGIGQPADFDGDGIARLPIVDSSGAMRLVNISAEENVKLGVPGVQKDPMASLDYDSDGNPEILYVDEGSDELRYIDGLETGTGSTQVVTVTDKNGEVIIAGDPSRGVS